MRILFFVFLLILPIFSYAETKTITKTAKVVVPENQSVEQVKQYTSDRLFREAAEEAGVAVSSSTVLVDGKVSKDEIKMQTSAIAKKDVKVLNQEIDNGQTFITVQVTATVDSGELDAFLRQLMQNEALKQELEQERKEKLALEKKLQNASKEEYDNTLSVQAANIAKARAARQKQLEKEISNAKQQLMEAQRRQQAEELKAAQELEQIQREYIAQDAALQARIAAEKDAQAKAEMEHQALLAELAKNALINDKTMDIAANDTVEIIAMDAAQVRTNFSSLVNEYKVAMNANSKQLEMYHKSQLAILEKQKFTEEMPKKGEWDNTATYNEKIAAYNKRKEDFENKKKQDIADLKAEYAERKIRSEKDTKTSLLKALKPLYERLKKYNTGMYTSNNTSRAVIDFGERDLDNLELPIIVKYKTKKYNFTYKFTSLQEFRAMYDTRASFIALPVYSVEPNGAKGAKPYLTGFKVIHLGNNKEQFFSVNADYEIFPEILQYEQMTDVPNTTLKNQEVEKIETTDTIDYSYKTYKKNTSDVLKITDSYKSSYYIYGFQAAVGFNLDIMNVEFAMQSHWRFNRWFGLYLNGGAIIGIGGLNSILQSDSNYNNYDDEYYGSSNRSSSSEDTIIDSGFAGGIGLDIYLTDNFLLFGEANIGYFFEYSGKNSLAGIFRGGIAFQNRHMIRGSLRFNAFIEGIFSETISGSSPYFGVGILF